MILAGDVGATKTVLQLVERREGDPRVAFERRYADMEFADFDGLLSDFLREAQAQGHGTPQVDIVVLGVAGPVSGGRVRLTNRGWQIDAQALAAKFGAGEVRLVNDFGAAASGLALLPETDLVTLQQGRPAARAPQVVLGAGTGLGVAYRVWQGERYQVIAGEGGNAGFAPADAEQLELWRSIHARAGRVCVEQVVSGPGLATIYEFLREQAAEPESPELARTLERDDRAAAIAAFALERGDPLARRALDLFIDAYGAAAGDHALAVLARGGVFVTGGIAPRIASRLQRGGFVAAFNAKGRYADLMADIPLYLVMNEKLALLGAIVIAMQLS